MWRYRELLPLPRGAEIVSLDEGGTPLINAKELASDLGLSKVYIKFEGANPTGSFKDRGMTLAVSIAKYLGAKVTIVASTGNTSASASAYSAKAGIKCVVVLPKGKVAKGKLAQSLLHGAEVVEINGNFDDALSLVLDVTRKLSRTYPLNSFNPWRLEGQKTLAFEVVDQLGGVPDAVIVPVGNAGNISAIWKGFKELRSLGIINKTPRLIGVQASGAAPLAKAWKEGLRRPQFIDKPETIASAIRIGRPINWAKALKAVKESKGLIIDVSDNEILNAYVYLARTEGIGVELASASTIAALRKLRDEKFIDRDETVVAIATGHALKDPETPLKIPSNVLKISNINELIEHLKVYTHG